MGPIQISLVCRETDAKKKRHGRPVKKSKEWIALKKDRRKKQGKE